MKENNTYCNPDIGKCDTVELHPRHLNMYIFNPHNTFQLKSSSVCSVFLALFYAYKLTVDSEKLQ